MRISPGFRNSLEPLRKLARSPRAGHERLRIYAFQSLGRFYVAAHFASVTIPMALKTRISEKVGERETGPDLGQR